ncbi:MAG: A24 family peptidase [Geminicoccaceae bacterium]
MTYWICMVLLAGLLLVGAIIDIRSRRLPNWLTAGVALLYLPYFLASPQPIDISNTILVAGVAFAIGFGLFAFNVMGGGDVKLIAGLSLWAGLDHLTLFLLVTSLAGGLLSIGMLMIRLLSRSTWIAMIWPIYQAEPDAPVPATDAPAAVTAGVRAGSAGSLPYGVAIAAGGFAVIYALLQL